MGLEIVWRNPLPVAKTEMKVKRVTVDQCGAVYLVNTKDLTGEYESILGGAA